MKSFFSPFARAVLLSTGLFVTGQLAQAQAPQPAPAQPSLAQALNPDGTLRPGAFGSFDARQFVLDAASDGRPVFRPTGATGAGDERWQNGFQLPNGTDFLVRAVVYAGTNVYIGGSFTTVGRVAATRVARWNGTTWSALGTGPANGVNGGVSALAVAPNGDLYVGGTFSEAGGVPASNVARWDGTAWHSLGAPTANGVSSASGGYAGVLALAVAPGGDVYMGGGFDRAGTQSANNVARWNGTAWTALGAGVSGRAGNSLVVYALALATNGTLYVSGDMPLAGGLPANGVAAWNGTAWTTLGTGLTNGIGGGIEANALAVTGSGDVYVGGSFSQAGGVSANGLAKWNGTAWSSLGTGVSSSADVRVTALAVAPNGDVYVGGDTAQVAGESAPFVARWNGTACYGLGTGLSSAWGDYVGAVAVAPGGDVYVGGNFTQAGGLPANDMARWSGGTWYALGTGTGNGLSAPVSALAVAGNGDVYAGGSFTQAGGVVANYVAKWNGTAWRSLGVGTANGIGGLRMGTGPSGISVNALAVAPNGDVYVGGNFTQAGGASASSVARWDGTTWAALGTGAANGVRGTVYALAVAPNGDVYAGGSFPQAGGVATNRVAKWDGTAWHSLGTGTANGISGSSSTVLALAVSGTGNVYVGGSFSQAGSIATRGVARWDGTTWAALGTGVTGGVAALAVAGNGDLYISGTFTQAGGTTANNVARWNGTTWSALGMGAANGVSGGNGQNKALAVRNNDVYVGGGFSQAGGTAANRLAHWNGTAWSTLGTGVAGMLAGQVDALTVDVTGKVYAGGYFATVGDASKVMVHFGIYDPNAPLSAAPTAGVCPTVIHPNPAHATATVCWPTHPRKTPLVLLDALGREVRRYPAPTGAEATLDLHGLPVGVYVLRHGSGSQRLVVE